jgi:hypothetical protein
MCLFPGTITAGTTEHAPIAEIWTQCAEPPSSHRGLWFSFFIRQGTHTAEVHTVGSDFDTQLALYYAGACVPRNWSCIANNDDVVPKNTSSRIVLYRPQTGQYWLYLHGYAHWTGRYRLSVTCSHPFLCSQAHEGQCNQELDGGTVLTNRDPVGIQGCQAAPSMAVTTWFLVHIKPPVSSVTFDTAGSDFDTQLSIFAGPNCAQRQCIASNDDVQGSQFSRVHLVVTHNRYMIAVHGYGSRWGRVHLTIQCNI